MNIRILKALWGMDDGLPLAERLDAIKEAGYDGVEYAACGEDPAAVRDLCAERDLIPVAMIFAATREEFSDQIKHIASFAPALVTSHSGRDRMSFEEACAFFDTALECEKRHGVPVAHETHRYRILYSPWQARVYLEKFPDLRLAADFSHWCVVCESTLDDADDVLQLAATRAIHVHGRVGFEEGPQVSDPRAPEFQAHVERHEKWWDRIVENSRSRGTGQLTFTPEYGPAPYLQTLPYTGQPVADLWEICLWAAGRARRRWQ